jgi:hypothetical protein
MTEPKYQKVLLKQSLSNRGFEGFAAFAIMFEIDTVMDKVHFAGQIDGSQIYPV